MLRELLELIPKTKDLWYADTFSLPKFGTLKQYYTGTVVLYCWWDPADDRISNQIDNMDLDFIIITSDPELLPVTQNYYQCIPGYILLNGKSNTDFTWS